MEGGRQLSPIDYGCISPPVKEPLSYRYKVIFEAILSLLEKYQPDAMAVETQYIAKNPQSVMKLGMAKGMAVLAASLRDIPVFEYAPSRAKKSVVGSGRASKVQVQAMVGRLLRLPKPPHPEDAADALALAICHGNTCQNKLEHLHRI